jgi:heme exporter protein D
VGDPPQMAHFLAMGGYARFVWPAYGVAAGVLLALLIHALVAYRQRMRELAALHRRR